MIKISVDVFMQWFTLQEQISRLDYDYVLFQAAKYEYEELVIWLQNNKDSYDKLITAQFEVVR